MAIPVASGSGPTPLTPAGSSLVGADAAGSSAYTTTATVASALRRHTATR